MRTRLAAGLMLFAAACGGTLDEGDELLDGQAVSGATEASEQELRSLNLRTMLCTTDSVDQPHFKHRFSINDTNTLFVLAQVRASAGNHSLVMEFVDPDGQIYQRSEQMVTVPQGRNRRSNQATFSLPMAGTWIQQFNMHGRWSMNGFLDGSTDPVATTNVILE